MRTIENIYDDLDELLDRTADKYEMDSETIMEYDHLMHELAVESEIVMKLIDRFDETHMYTFPYGVKDFRKFIEEITNKLTNSELISIFTFMDRDVKDKLKKLLEN